VVIAITGIWFNPKRNSWPKC